MGHKAEISESFLTSTRWNDLAPYLAFLIGTVILLLIMFGNKPQDNHEKLQKAGNIEHPLETAATQTATPAQEPNVAITNGTTTPVSVQPDPFKAFLDAHKNIQPPPVNLQPAPKTQQEIRDVFKAAVEKDISSAYPFANVKTR